MRRFFLALALFLLITVAGGYALVASERGSAWIVELALAAVDGEDEG